MIRLLIVIGIMLSITSSVRSDELMSFNTAKQCIVISDAIRDTRQVIDIFDNAININYDLAQDAVNVIALIEIEIEESQYELEACQANNPGNCEQLMSNYNQNLANYERVREVYNQIANRVNKMYNDRVRANEISEFTSTLYNENCLGDVGRDIYLHPDICGNANNTIFCTNVE